MNTTPTEESILRTDTKGRLRTPLARREQLLDEFEKSGLSGPAFAKVVGVKYSTLATWTQKRRRARGASAVKVADPLSWMEAVVGEPGPGENPLILELSGGVKMAISDAGQAALAAVLLRALAKPC